MNLRSNVLKIQRNILQNKENLCLKLHKLLHLLQTIFLSSFIKTNQLLTEYSLIFYNQNQRTQESIQMTEAVSSISLVNDPTVIGRLNSERVMVAVPLLYLFMTHYLFQALRLIKSQNDKAQRLNDHGKRLFLYGVAALFSINFLQSSIVMAILAWATLICMIINHCFVFLKETGHKYHNNGLLIYYGLLMVWYLAIIFFYIYQANTP